jgi:hypothetical protein
LREGIQRQIENSLELLSDDLKSVWQQLHETLQRDFADTTRGVPSLPEFHQQRDELLRKIELTLLERGSGQHIEQQLGKALRGNRAVAPRARGRCRSGRRGHDCRRAGPYAAVDVTGAVAGVAAVFGTVVALVKRRKILNAFRDQMKEKRESVLAAIEDHLRHAVDRFYAELATTFQPLQTFCATQRKRYEPMLTGLAELETTFTRSAAELTHAESKGAGAAAVK